MRNPDQLDLSRITEFRGQATNYPRPGSSEEHLPTSITEVLRLRAIRPSVCDRSATRFAPTARRGRQDDGFVEKVDMQLVGCRKLEKHRKVTGHSK